MLWRERTSRGRPRNAPAAFIHPCRPTVAQRPPRGPGWAHELKHDGYRLQIHEANEATIVDWIAQGQFDCPLRVVAFNTWEGWSRDVTKEIATKLLDLNKEGVALGAVARDFVERITGQTPITVA
jgi:hypothetical protein